VRTRVDDADFEANVITIREKKRDRSRELTFRPVTMAQGLRSASRQYLDRHHPGRPYLLVGRHGNPLTEPLLTNAFRWAVAVSPWQMVAGYHVLRHSFASHSALKGIDQRVIDSWMGHQTEAIRQLYRHLFPDQQRTAMDAVFGARAAANS
jgi:integrase